MARRDGLIVGLDIGTTKICVVVAERTETGVDIVGIGTHPSRGLRKGVVVDIDATVDSIKHAVEEAELMADCEITSVYAGIAGGHIRGFNSQGMVAVKEREVGDGDVRRVIDAAKAVTRIDEDRRIAAERLQLATGRGTLQRAHAGGTDRNDTTAARTVSCSGVRAKSRAGVSGARTSAATVIVGSPRRRRPWYRDRHRHPKRAHHRWQQDTRPP